MGEATGRAANSPSVSAEHRGHIQDDREVGGLRLFPGCREGLGEAAGVGAVEDSTGHQLPCRILQVEAGEAGRLVAVHAQRPTVGGADPQVGPVLVARSSSGRQVHRVQARDRGELSSEQGTARHEKQPRCSPSPVTTRLAPHPVVPCGLIDGKVLGGLGVRMASLFLPSGAPFEWSKVLPVTRRAGSTMNRA